MNVTTDAYTLPTINVTTSSTSNSITINVNATPGDGSIVSYHYSKDDGSNYQTSNNNTYTFSGLTSGTTYYLKVYVTDNNGRISGEYRVNIATKNPQLVDYIVNNVYTGVDGGNGLYYHDGQGTYGSLEAGDNSYRYAGANPNNYVCFGTDSETCPSNNLYRIIGVFDNQVKLIKDTSYGTYAFDETSNVWNKNTKPEIFTTLNVTYYNTLISKWQNLIAETLWQVGGMAYNETSTPKQYYINEVGTGQSGYEETMKIGLMYVSDFGYASNPSNWSLAMSSYDANTDNNWIYIREHTWTISRINGGTTNQDSVFFLMSLGYIEDGHSSNTFEVFPTFYLNSDITYVSGTGTQTDPYRIA